MGNKVFEKEKRIVKSAHLPNVLPKNSVKRISELLGVSHPKVCNVSSGNDYDEEILKKLKKELTDGQDNIRIALSILEAI